jgi:hypothetical protein
VISDTDHSSPMDADAVWAWKSFLRGHNPILYDLGLFGGFDPLDPALEAARRALGDTRSVADRLDLARIAPHGELTSSGFALARPAHDDVALCPGDDDAPCWLHLVPGTHDVTWFDVDGHREVPGDAIVVDAPGRTHLDCPLPATHTAVVHVSRTS